MRWFRRSARVRLSPGDMIALALLGPRSRPTRAALSALGVAVGIAALIAITGATSSQQAQVREELDAMGANLLVVAPGKDASGSPIPVPSTATGMIGRIGPVEGAAAVRSLDELSVFRNDMIPTTQSGGLVAALAEGDLLGTLDIGMAQGRWFDEASRTLPTTVLGSKAAARLGITDLGTQPRVVIGGQWYAVIGILEPAGLAASLDTTAFVADRWQAEEHEDAAIVSIYVRTGSGRTEAVRSVLAATANPANPRGVAVSRLSELADAQQTADSAMSSLVLGLAAIALLVGGIGIANTMIVAVLERRGEIGLRRALGAGTGQVAGQFVLEAVFLAFAGGVAGTLLGVLTVVGLTTWQGTALALDPVMLAVGPFGASVIGAIAGLYPATRAARMPPNAALRAV